MTAAVVGGVRGLPAGRPERPRDLRLVAPAVAVWLGAFLGTGGATSARWLPGGLVLGAVLVFLARRPLGGRRSAGMAATAVVICAGAGWLVGLAQVAQLRGGPVDQLAAQRATAVAEGTLAGDPTIVAGAAWAGPLVLAPLRLSGLEARGRQVRLRVRVLVLADDDGWRGLLPGQRVRVTGRLGPARPGQPVAAVLRVRSPPALAGRPPLLQRAAGRLRDGLRQASRGLPKDAGGLLPGLVVGDTSSMTPGLAEDFRSAGLTHLTAVSGANLAIVTGAVLLAARWAGVRGRALPLLAFVAMLGFVVLARPEPSVLRAAVMGGIGLAALATGRERRSIAALGAAVLVLVLADPWLARSYGFVLSVLATAALVLLAPGWAQAWAARGVPLRLAQAIAVPLAAQLVSAPVVVLLSDQVSVVAVVANVLVAPAVAPATVLGVLAAVVSPLTGAGAALLAQIAGWFVGWIVLVARWAADLPVATVAWPGTVRGSLALAGLTVAVVVAARWSGRTRRRALGATGVGLVSVLALAVPLPGDPWPPPDWRVAACDVGQGDAIVLAVAPGTAVLVDTGPEPAAVDRCLRRLEITRIPLIILTHLHADHIDGLPGVLRGRSIGAVQVSRYLEPAEALTRLRRWLRPAAVPLRTAAVGERGRAGPLRWKVLWPARRIEAGSVANNVSQVLLVRSHGVRMLLLGDVELAAQQALVASGSMSLVDVLKVAHHGSAYQQPQVLQRTRPAVALVSVGAANDFGHPAPGTLRRLRGSGAVVARTDQDGTVLVVGRRGSLRVVSGRR